MIIFLLLVIVAILLLGSSRFIGGIGVFFAVLLFVCALSYLAYLTKIDWIYLLLGFLALVTVGGIWAKNYDERGLRKGSAESEAYANLLGSVKNRKKDHGGRP